MANKVLHLLAGGDAGGAETYFTEAVSALATAGLSQYVVMRPNASRETALTASGVPLTFAPFGNLLDVKTKRVVRSAIASFQPTIVQAWMGRAASFLTAR